MRFIVLFFLMSIVMPMSASALPTLAPSNAIPRQAPVSFAALTVQLPEAKGRTGSKRVGGYTSKGKGSRYVGGRR